MSFENLKSMTLAQLITKLHESIKDAAKGVDALEKENREIALVDIINIREHAKERMRGARDEGDREKLLKLIELFKKDRNALYILKLNMQDWVDFLDVISEHVARNTGEMSASEVKKMEALRQDIAAIKTALRKG